MESDKALYYMSIPRRSLPGTVVQQRISCTAMVTVDWDVNRTASGPAGRSSRSAFPTWQVARCGQRRGIPPAVMAAPVYGVGRTT